MDLQWQRQAEHWLRLMDGRGAPGSARLTLRLGRDNCGLEALADGRAQLSLRRPLPEAERLPSLLRLLALLLPEAGDGAPQRAWLARGCLWLAATAPAGSGAERWAWLSRRQLQLMDRAAEGGHEAR
ncbi:type III secretion protein [Chromobacterium phragmitis]|uniref:Type III secretion protein n=1 Tax=Chromobacterium phragmitis TaxID=2202141 RepID=A0A344UKY0_9NEIS|nr:type III secretion protein [Chromobacterium phragmitis]AXE30556.1 type III secretion protein [Chromobacterium phragmitis]AXE35928.1 type III secretion protein [Chromobacterium phragmitis]